MASKSLNLSKRFPGLYSRLISLREPRFEQIPLAVHPVDFDSQLIGQDQTDDPLIRLLLERKGDPTSKLGSRPDGRKLALVIEGGGMTGVISAGMCVMLEAADLIDCFDSIYGCSSGALAAIYTCSGQAALGSTNFQDCLSFDFINPGRALVRKPIIDLDILFNTIIGKKKPLDFERLKAGPELGVVAVTLEDPKLEVLKDFQTREEVLAATRASCSLPILAGPAPKYKNKVYVDGGVLSAVPYQAAIDDGATDILVLRSRRASYRKDAFSAVSRYLAEKNCPPSIWPLVENIEDTYNQEIENLHQLIDCDSGPNVKQITVPEHYKDLVGKLTTKKTSVDAGLKIGIQSMAAELIDREIDVFWTPRIFTDKHFDKNI